ncbi:MbcA/ParS/Xre antitoxin family protein [Desulfoferula mesophila]|uniref:Antitoxin Xre/MbcA/ParS-like toxin-binding domain-containing protein n=1 Tax=Desulfoferula mesophila TaxID=3058419 RepID=A0AAU9EEW8_9BACT|nr:hypothetical protein FAK_27190 [Desulfoferula mesophilus]
MPLAQIQEATRPDLASPQAREGMAKLVTNLFDRWGLDTAQQLQLLGMSPSSRAALGRYRQGRPLPDSRDLRDRVGLLLAVHKALGLLYPHNPNLKYGWVKRRNQAFDNRTPLETMIEQGIAGLARVARYLDYVRGV